MPSIVPLASDLTAEDPKEDPNRHAHLAASWLREAGVHDAVVNGVLAHAHPEYQKDLMSKGIVAEAIWKVPALRLAAFRRRF